MDGELWKAPIVFNHSINVIEKASHYLKENKLIPVHAVLLRAAMCTEARPFPSYMASIFLVIIVAGKFSH